MAFQTSSNSFQWCLLLTFFTKTNFPSTFVISLLKQALLSPFLSSSVFYTSSDPSLVYSFICPWHFILYSPKHITSD